MTGTSSVGISSRLRKVWVKERRRRSVDAFDQPHAQAPSTAIRITHKYLKRTVRHDDEKNHDTTLNYAMLHSLELRKVNLPCCERSLESRVCYRTAADRTYQETAPNITKHSPNRETLFPGTCESLAKSTLFPSMFPVALDKLHDPCLLSPKSHIFKPLPQATPSFIGHNNTSPAKLFFAPILLYVPPSQQIPSPKGLGLRSIYPPDFCFAAPSTQPNPTRLPFFSPAMPTVYRSAMQAYIDNCRAAHAYSSSAYPRQYTSSQHNDQRSGDMSRYSSILPHAVERKDDDRSHRRSRRPRADSHPYSRPPPPAPKVKEERSFLPRRRRTSTTNLSPPPPEPAPRRKSVRFSDAERPPTTRRPALSQQPSRPKTFAKDAPPVAISESARDTAKRLFHRRPSDGGRPSARPPLQRVDTNKTMETTRAEMGTRIGGGREREREREHRSEKQRSRRR